MPPKRLTRSQAAASKAEDGVKKPRLSEAGGSVASTSSQNELSLKEELRRANGRIKTLESKVEDAEKLADAEFEFIRVLRKTQSELEAKVEQLKNKVASLEVENANLKKESHLLPAIPKEVTPLKKETAEKASQASEHIPDKTETLKVPNETDSLTEDNKDADTTEEKLQKSMPSEGEKENFISGEDNISTNHLKSSCEDATVPSSVEAHLQSQTQEKTEETEGSTLRKLFGFTTERNRHWNWYIPRPFQSIFKGESLKTGNGNTNTKENELEVTVKMEVEEKIEDEEDSADPY